LGYNAAVTSKKGVIGIGLPFASAAQSRNRRRSCGFHLSGPSFGGLNVGAQARLQTASAGAQVVQPVQAAALIGLLTAVFQTALQEANMANLSIGTSAIREIDGLFSLNDLHRASGGELKHRPTEFLRIAQTQELVKELSRSGDSHFIKTTRGRYASTYACKELVIAYAAWISAAFHLRVIRVFLGAQVPQALPETLEATVARLAVQIGQSNAYPIQIFWPLIDAINVRTKQGRISVNATHLNNICLDLATMAKQAEAFAQNLQNAKRRVDGLAILESDLRPEWWAEKRLKA
jgi:KilA-N domain